MQPTSLSAATEAETHPAVANSVLVVLVPRTQSDGMYRYHGRTKQREQVPPCQRRSGTIGAYWPLVFDP